ncbi:MAG TPA: signal peptidase II, partial [Noviherbaspirillum sp.]|nr:signal peptidase II [Noviherbaspirillum sp.]
MATKKKPSLASSGSSASLAPWLGIAAIIVLIDQITMVTINKLFVFGESRPVTSFFNLVLAHNKGAAFSFLAAESGWQRYLFTGIALAAVVFILYLL